MENPAQGEKRSPIPGPGSLRSAIRKARIEQAERSDVIGDLRAAALARLELLQDAISGVLAEVPEGVDLFDTGLVPGERPRLFIDMIAFVEMARDHRTYRFLQDTRYGRITILETDHLGPIVEAITNYVARRLVEREKALASDLTLPPLPAPAAVAQPPAPAPVAEAPAAPLAETAPAAAPAPAPIVMRARAATEPSPLPPEPHRGSVLRGLMNSLALIALILLVVAAAYFSAQELLHAS